MRWSHCAIPSSYRSHVDGRDEGEEPAWSTKAGGAGLLWTWLCAQLCVVEAGKATLVGMATIRAGMKDPQSVRPGRASGRCWRVGGCRRRTLGCGLPCATGPQPLVMLGIHLASTGRTSQACDAQESVLHRTPSVARWHRTPRHWITPESCWRGSHEIPASHHSTPFIPPALNTTK